MSDTHAMESVCAMCSPARDMYPHVLSKRLESLDAWEIDHLIYIFHWNNVYVALPSTCVRALSSIVLGSSSWSTTSDMHNITCLVLPCACFGSVQLCHIIYVPHQLCTAVCLVSFLQDRNGNNFSSFLWKCSYQHLEESSCVEDPFLVDIM